jgi:hypothetical protein
VGSGSGAVEADDGAMVAERVGIPATGAGGIGNSLGADEPGRHDQQGK